jgi:hypothetical protein
VANYSLRKALQKAALESLKSALALCPHNQPLIFHLALLYADIREHTHAIAGLSKCPLSLSVHCHALTLPAFACTCALQR